MTVHNFIVFTFGAGYRALVMLTESAGYRAPGDACNVI